MQQDELTLVIGGTAGTGREIVTRLLRDGYRVRVMTRHPEATREKMGEEVEVVRGDLTRPETLPAAVDGVDHLIVTAGLPRRFIPRSRAKEMIHDGTLAVLAAAEKAALPGRFMYMSALGTTRWSIGGFLLNLLKGGTLHWRRLVEEKIRRGGLAHTIIHAGVLSDGPPDEKAIEISTEEHPLSLQYRISRGDVAEVFVQALRSPQTRNTSFDVFWKEGSPSHQWENLFAELKPASEPPR